PGLKEGAEAKGAYLDGASVGRKVRACVWARSMGDYGILRSGGRAVMSGELALRTPSASEVVQVNIWKTPDYNETCTMWIDNWVAGPVTIRFQHYDPGVMRTLQIILYEGMKVT